MRSSTVLTTLQRLPQTVLLGLVRGYRLLLSPWLGSACRFTPTCSAYALAAITQHGAAGGSYLTLARLVRCHPWCAGGIDNVPAKVHAPRLFSRFLETPSSADISPPSSVSKTLL